jgi:hypothetical protein
MRLRLSDLLDAATFDADGQPLGRVKDVRLVQDGPYVEGFGQALRVAGVIVGQRAYGIRLGFERAKVTGPWPLTALFRRFEERASYIPWDDVAEWRPGLVRLAVGATLGRASE